MAHLEPLLRFWRAVDARLEQVEPAWWGAGVADTRVPAIWDVNPRASRRRPPANQLR